MSSRSAKTLPQEIIIDILLRLPVKSLCRFRCVSKPWLALINDPHFVTSHLRHNNTHKLILASHSLYSVNHEATPIDEEVVAVKLDFPLKSIPRNDQVQIFGSCNGLLCIMPVPKVFFLFNPATREAKRIPEFQLTSLNYSSIHGFGYSEVIDDYKLVKVIVPSIVCVFSLRTGSWRRVKDCHYLYPVGASGTPLNGAIHWVLTRPGDGVANVVVAAFDLVEEVFKDISLPEALRDFGLFSLATGVLGGCLCVLHHHGDLRREFWVMKEYGVEKSWTKVLMQQPYHVLRPLCMWKNCKMLLAVNEQQLVLCNRRDGSCKDFVVFDMPLLFDADIYVESLVSPNYGNRN
ncbi:F-box/kelch-repeat protein At3g06240-like [Pistacia vera]|uniref:F-box/kelch-repeat protein At3g06240-like n=1 Tax=Pistacia vera TaxID=55513 RepID=UPI0012634580|nr:F-box/kelch-repeat protein At3g06240-like [Pistacia vera]